MIAGIIFIALAIASRAIADLSNHGKIKWKSKDPYGFWGEEQDKRKYKDHDSSKGPRFPLSTSFLVFITDGFHFMQLVSHLCISLAVISFLGLRFGWLWLVVWMGVVGVHFVARAITKQEA